MSEIKVQNINTDNFNPFGATEEELLANALDESGLVTTGTIINDIAAKEYCRLYFDKRENYKNSTKLGNLLINNFVITSLQLQDALDYQRQNPSKRLGDALVALEFCTHNQIEECIDAQTQIRYDIRELDDFVEKINSLKERLKKYISI